MYKKANDKRKHLTLETAQIASGYGYTHTIGRCKPEWVERAKPSCSGCHGTGNPGDVLHPANRKNSKAGLVRVERCCACVIRASSEKVPWLQRHGVDKQWWLWPQDRRTVAQGGVL